MNRDGMICGMPADEYHSGNEISASALKMYRAEVPARFQLYRTGKLKKESKSFAFGTNAHMRLLEPDRWAEQCVIGPEVNRNKKEWKEFESANPGKTTIKPSEDVYGEMVERARSSCMSFRWLLDQPGETEVSFFWTDPDSGVRCRIRVDKIIEIYSKILIVDLKTTVSLRPTKWSMQARKLFYDIQEAFYRRGVSHVTGKDCEFVFGVIETDSYLSGVRQLAERAVSKADIRISAILADIAERDRSGDWPGYGDDVQVFDLPEWEYS